MWAFVQVPKTCVSNYPSVNTGTFTNFAMKNPIESFLMSSGGAQCKMLGPNLCSKDACVSSNRIPEIPFPPKCGVCKKIQKISTNLKFLGQNKSSLVHNVLHQTNVSTGFC